MNILIISYGIKEYDGRLIEIRNVAKKLGECHVVCCSKEKTKSVDESIIYIGKGKYLSVKHLIKFFIISVYSAIKMKKIDILIADNFFASIPVLVINKLFNPSIVIQDVRELYFIEEIKKLWARFLSKCETKLMKESDIVLCANRHRAHIMMEHYKLQKEPIVFENIRFLTGEYDENSLDKKYEGVFKYKYNIISTGGLSVNRKTDDLVASIKHLTSDYGLFIIGDGTINDKKQIKDIILSDDLSNVHLLGKVPMNELKYIVQHCDIGVVHYHKNDLNNQYCASGKVYEYLAEGLPIVTTENIPLQDFCQKTGVGIADDSFYQGIKEIANLLDTYKDRVKGYISEISVDNNNTNVAVEIKRQISEREK
jgi:glycosyltransferase involved in cell wall biosynthesis